ncbi:MAG: glycoside hydrolase family 43 C-terminal domain-containing protein [Deltaproteobacteria bacterium]|nr:glycoside hydrolase family 43 C-terminal domain-containing protein [Deltaproteobacteria bacterium]
MQCFQTVRVVLAAVLFAVPVQAKPFVDTKKRFQIEPAAGWELAPLPGDTRGMNFRKKVDGVPGLLHVTVDPLAPGQTVKQTLDAADAPLRVEIGFNPGTEVPAAIGSFNGLRRTLSVFASGDKNTVRSIEIYALHAFGFAHVLHFETLEKKRGSFTRDLDRMLASYLPLIGKDLAAPLSSLWINTGGGPDLTLEESGEFSMGPLNGGWRSDGGIIELKIPSGTEKYRYQLNGDTLTLSSPNLGGDLVFRRSTSRSGKTFAPQVIAGRPPGPVTREELIGTWRVVDQAATEVLKMILAPTGSVSFGPLAGRWRFATGRLTITSTAGSTITYAASLNDGRLVLSGGDLDKDVTLERE